MFNMLDQSFKWFTSYIPFFLLIRLFIIIWLQSPTSDGALHVYRKIVRPFADNYGDLLYELDQEFIKPYEKISESSENKAEKEVRKTAINDNEPKKPDVQSSEKSSTEPVSTDQIKLEEKETKQDY